MANPQPVRAIRNAPRTITQRSGSYSGKGMLTAELLVGFGIVLIRIIGDFTVDTTTGKAKSNVLHNSSVYGPFPIAVGLIGVFFVLSFLAASGGKKAKFAVVFGGLVVTALGVKSIGEIDKIAKTIGNIGTYKVPAPSGKEGSGASSPIAAVNIPGIPGSPGSPGTTNPVGVIGGSGPGGITPTPTGYSTLPIGDLGPGTSSINPGGTNSAVSTLPPGAILATNGTCPSGYIAFTLGDGTKACQIILH
jgi:hypothetical protein